MLSSRYAIKSQTFTAANIFLKNGAMYSLLFLGIIMIMDSFGFHIPVWFSPVTATSIVGYFFWKSRGYNKKGQVV